MKVSKIILIVDDNDMTRKLVYIILNGEGYKIIEAASGQECLEILKEVKPDLILMDIHLTDYDGALLAKLIKSSEALSHIPILAFTGSVKYKAQYKVFDHFVLKPIEHQELINLIRKFI